MFEKNEQSLKFDLKKKKKALKTVGNNIKI